MVANALSRIWACSLMEILKVHQDWVMDIQEENLLDEEVAAIWQKLQHGSHDELVHYKLQNGLIYYTKIRSISCLHQATRKRF